MMIRILIIETKALTDRTAHCDCQRAPALHPAAARCLIRMMIRMLIIETKAYYIL